MGRGSHELARGENMDRDRLREIVKWNAHYQRNWDAMPDHYVDSGFLSLGKSRRLGRLEKGSIKAYIGVQHVDPERAGWAVIVSAHARFFASLFINGRVVTLRSFKTVDLALEWLSEATQWPL